MLKRKPVIMIAVMAMLLLASCSSDLGFFSETENTSSITILPGDTSEESDENEEAGEITTGSSEDNIVEANKMPAYEECDFTDEDYFKEKPETIPQDVVYTQPGDTMFRDDLKDDILLNDANELFEKGYVITSAEQLAQQGACIGVDEDHYLYRGFAAIYFTEDRLEVTDLVYEYILPKEAFDLMMEPYKGYEYSESQQGTKFFYTVEDSLYISYDTATEVMYYSTVPVG